MSEIATTNDAINAARAAIAKDVATVTAAIDNAIADVDAQLTTLQERRQELEAALNAVNGEIAATDDQRTALVAARTQVPQVGEALAAEAEQDVEWEDADVDEDALDPQLPRTERIVTILTASPTELSAADVAEILNTYGDDTTTKVVSGTLSNLGRRGAVTKVAPGVYTAA